MLTRVYVRGVRGSKHNSASRNKFAVGGDGLNLREAHESTGWRVFCGASIRNCTAAYASSACFAHVSHRAAIWLHVVFSSPRLELAMRPHSAAWRRNSSDGFTAVPRRRIARPWGASSGVASQFQHSSKKHMLRRSNVATKPCEGPICLCMRGAPVCLRPRF